MKAPPKVFVSATSGDLRHVREIVRDALLSIGCMPVVQEHFTPDHRDVATMLQEKIAGCDALIHIAGMRYGAEPDPDSLVDGQSRRSFTHMELDIARDLKLEKVFTFVCSEDFAYTTEDADGNSLSSEPEELVQLQQQHRARLLGQAALYQEVDQPEDVALKVREIQLDLEQIKSALEKSRRRTLAVGVAAVLALLAIAGGVTWLMRDTSEVKAKQAELAQQVELQRQAPRVIIAYQDRFREIRNDPNQKLALPNEIIDKMVRAELPGMVDLDRELVDQILEIEAPKLVARSDTPLHLQLAALFVMGEYETVLEKGREQLLEPTVSGLRSMGDAAMAQFEKTPGKELHEEAARYYRGSQALIDKAGDPEAWADASFALGVALRMNANYDEAEQLLRDTVTTYSGTLGENHIKTLDSINSLAVLLDLRGQDDEAGLLYRKAFENFERLLGREHPRTLQSMDNLASLLKGRGAYDEAEALRQELNEVSLRVLGADNPQALTAIGNLAALRLSQGNAEQAEILQRQAVEGFKRVLGEGHPFTQYSIRRLAGCLKSLGRYDEADALYQESVEYGARVLGRNHPLTLGTIGAHAILMKTRGKAAEAEKLFREVLKAQEEVLGSEHHQTLGTIENLATALAEQGRYKEASPLYDRVLQANARILGPEHPSTLQTMHNHAALLKSMGKYDEAEALYTQVIEAKRRVLGNDHPDTLSAINNLAVVLNLLKRPDEAEPLYREACETRERTLGRDHPQTLVSTNNFALFLRDQGDLDEAEALFERIVETAEQVLGREHPNTLTMLGNLATVYQLNGSPSQAEPLLREVLEIETRVQGPDHPDSLRATSSLGRLLKSLDRLDEAEALYWTALQGNERVLGSDHPTTLATTINLENCLKAQGKKDDAAKLRERRFQSTARTSPPDSMERAKNAHFYGVHLATMRRHDDAVEQYQEALRIYEALPGTEQTQRHCRTSLAANLRELGEVDRARAMLQEVIDEGLDDPNSDPFRDARARHQLALCEVREENWLSAENWLRDAVAYYDQINAPSRSMSGMRTNAIRTYRSVLTKQSLSPEAIKEAISELNR